ncbi:4'-phosphopantetheinyl transferase family protein [Sphingomonas sp. M6A6_1c]
MTITIEAVLVDLDVLAACNINGLTTWEEAYRAARYRGPATSRFLARRAAMRLIVARRLACRPQDVILVNGRLGRPLIAGGGIHVSQSSRGRYMLAVTCLAQEVGCDIEDIRNDIDMAAIAETCFSPAERRMLVAVMSEQRARAFYDCWARKEAYMKATGTGFALGMESFETSHRFGSTTQDGRVDWTAETWTPAPGLIAAIVTRGTDWRLLHRDFEAPLNVAIAA